MRPPRARGLKQVLGIIKDKAGGVAPPAGAWIETGAVLADTEDEIVAPPAGAWIETGSTSSGSSLASVAPPAGAWIETGEYAVAGDVKGSRAPRGRVD